MNGLSTGDRTTVGCVCCFPAICVLVLLLPLGNSKPGPQSPPQPDAAQASTSPQVIYKEKEIIREIVKVRCEYCGTLVDISVQNCPSCGAPQHR